MHSDASLTALLFCQLVGRPIRDPCLVRIGRLQGSIFHASSVHLDRFDNVQMRFLRDIRLDPSRAAFEFNVLPLTTRRNISMLGFLHNVVLRDCHRRVIDLFPRDRARPRRANLRSAPHNPFQFVGQLVAEDAHVLRRSVFGMLFESATRLAFCLRSSIQ